MLAPGRQHTSAGDEYALTEPSIGMRYETAVSTCEPSSRKTHQQVLLLAVQLGRRERVLVGEEVRLVHLRRRSPDGGAAGGRLPRRRHLVRRGRRRRRRCRGRVVGGGLRHGAAVAVVGIVRRRRPARISSPVHVVGVPAPRAHFSAAAAAAGRRAAEQATAPKGGVFAGHPSMAAGVVAALADGVSCALAADDVAAGPLAGASAAALVAPAAAAVGSPALLSSSVEKFTHVARTDKKI